MTFYEILWTDSEASNGWEKAEDFKFPSKLCKSRGWFIVENEEYLALAADYDEENKMYNRFIAIPKVNIKKKRKIKV